MTRLVSAWEPAVVILAAGRSTRMGQTKQLLPFDGTTVLGRVVAEAVESRFRPVVLVLGHRADDVWESLPSSQQVEVCRVDNVGYPSGVGSSVRVGLAAVPGDTPAFVVLGDLPFFTKDVLEELLDEYRHVGGLPVRVAVEGQLGHPVLLTPDLIQRANELQGDQGFRLLLQGARSRELPHRLRSAVFDVDTPDDYERALCAKREGSGII